MFLTNILTLIIIAANVLVSYKGFKSSDFMARYELQVDKIVYFKDYKRLLTSAFLHVNWLHLIFNMLALYFFSATLGQVAGAGGFLIIYILGILGGNLFAVYIQRRNSAYHTIGATPGINAVMFACITMIPGMVIGLFFVPLPGWLIGIAYLLFSMYAIRSRKEGVSYEALFGAGILGILTGILIQPSSLQTNLWVILLLLIPSLLFLFLIIRYPHMLITGSIRPRTNYTLEDRENLRRKSREEELNEILDKINKKGIHSLTQKEKDILNSFK